jgi:tetratricopeptide (TPR) repeat protein
MAATSQGDLSRTPLPQIVTFLAKKRLTGTLVVFSERDEPLARIHFADGMPAHVESSDQAGRLGELLVIRGVINAKTLAEALRGMKDREVRLGRYLVEEGLVDEAQLRSAMEFQLEQRLGELYALKDERFEFHGDSNLTGLEPAEMFPVDAVAWLPRAVREKWRTEELDAQLARLRGHRIRCRGRELGDLDWSAEEEEALRRLSGQVHSLESALAVEEHLRTPVRVVLYVLMLTGGLELTTAPPEEAPAPQPEAKRARPEAKPQEQPDRKLEELKAAVSDKIAQINDGDLFEVLEIDDGASTEEIRKSYLALVKRFHPDRAAAADDPQLKENMAFISGRIKEAADTLTTADRRKDYERQRAGGPTRSEEEAIVQQTIAAEMSFQKAVILARRKKWREAIELMEPVVEIGEPNGEHLALLTWARANEAGPGAELAAHEADLRRAVELAPKSEKANFFLAQVLKRSGKETEAMVHLKTVVDINPHNIDAKRELLILNRRRAQRRRDGKETEEDGGDDGSTLGRLKKILKKKL